MKAAERTAATVISRQLIPARNKMNKPEAATKIQIEVLVCAATNNVVPKINTSAITVFECEGGHRSLGS